MLIRKCPGKTETGQGFVPDAEVIALLAIGGNHSPILLYLYSVRERRKKEFKFEALWPYDQECIEIIKRTWLYPRLPRRSFISKVQKVSNELDAWSKREFSNASRHVGVLKKKLTQRANRTSGAFCQEVSQEIMDQIENGVIGLQRLPCNYSSEATMQ